MNQNKTPRIQDSLKRKLIRKQGTSRNQEGQNNDEGQVINTEE